MRAPHHNDRTPSARRRGVASLELVLSLPFLLVAAAMIFALGSAGTSAGLAAIAARRDAWSRPPTSRDPLIWPDDPAEDFSEGHGEARLLASSALPRVADRAEASHAVLNDPWDHRSVPFDPRPALVPHFDEIARLTRGAPSGFSTAALDGLRLGDLADLGAPGQSGDLLNAVSDAAGGGGGGIGLGDFAGEIDKALGSDDNNLGGALEAIDDVLGTASDALGGGGGLVGDILGEAADKVEDATGIPLGEVKSLGKLASGLKGLDGLDADISGLFSGGGSGGSIGSLGDLGDLSHGAAQAQNEVLQGAALVMKLASGAVSPMRTTVGLLDDLSSDALDLIGMGDSAEKIKEAAEALDENQFDPFDDLYDAAHGK